jgi:hypothetical protein
VVQDQERQRGIARGFGRRRRLAYAGLWLVVAEILAVLVASQVGAAPSGRWLWALLLGPALVYLVLLWRVCRCAVCGALLLVDAGPYQRVVFNLNARICPCCGAPLA